MDGYRVRTATPNDIAPVLDEAAERKARACGAPRLDAIVLADNGLGAEAWQGFGYRAARQWVVWQKWLTG